MHVPVSGGALERLRAAPPGGGPVTGAEAGGIPLPASLRGDDLAGIGVPRIPRPGLHPPNLSEMENARR